MEIVVLLIATVILSIVNYGYIKKDSGLIVEKKLYIKKILPSSVKQVILYLMIPLSLVVLSLMYNKFYDFELIYTLKRVCLIAVLWPIALSDFKEYRIPNILILYGLVIRLILVVFELIFSFETILPIIISEIIAAVATVVICLFCM